MPTIAVVGAGIVGLTTAAHIQSLLPQAQVTIIADKFNGDTTSDGAAGLLLPAANFRGPTFDITKDWIAYSYKYYEQLLQENCGVYEISGFMLSSVREEDVKNELMVGVAAEFRPATHQELLQYPGNWKYGSFMTTLLICCRTFLPWLLERIKSRGATVVKRTVQDLKELSGSYDVVVNCSGLQARWLCDDIHVAPIRGQIVKVKAPTVDKFLFGDGPDTYIIPNGDGLVSLGGTCQYNVWEPTVRAHDSVGIKARCSAILPSLQSAPVAWEWAGLRPYRHCVRVEPEWFGSSKVVHNYGHGGYGVTSAPGTARDAARLVLQLVNSHSKL
ncbi:D-aspartate oxidase-like [Macrosteles quadrilineatus]|uniref:D-aspartate oxidase-like n=1 Tax=Macrosteles quadrilineatus TaxID=74068 RepID=UPI0023E1738A|nr:D-aspartate oxidase-like [Macrosteles quadrilineatus]